MSDVDKFQLQEEAAAQRAEQAARDRRERNAADLREAPLRGPASRERSTRRVPLATIHPVENIRADLPEIHELARSIREVGLLTPLLVQPWQGEPPASAPDDADVDHYRLIAGHRRHAALRALADAGLDGYDDVACEVAGELSEAEAYALMLTENVQRVPLEPIQAARALRLLLDLNEGMTAAELARSLGLKPAWVQKHLKLLELPEDVQQRLADGDLSITVADLLRRGQSSGRLDEAQVRTMAREVSAGTMTAAEVRAKAAPPRPNSPAPRTEGPGRPTGPARWEQVPPTEPFLEPPSEQGYYKNTPPRPATPLSSSRLEQAAAAAAEPMPSTTAGPAGEHFDAPLDERLDAYLLGRALTEWADDDYLDELGIDRVQCEAWANVLEFDERIFELRRLSQTLMLADGRAAPVRARAALVPA